MYNIIALFAPILSCFLLIRRIRSANIIEHLLIFFNLFTAHILIFGYVLSFFNKLSDVKLWSLFGIASFFIAVIFIIILPASKQVVQKKYLHELKLSFFEKMILTPMLITSIFIVITNLVVIFFTAPHNWDSMTYHLARVAYYLQNNNLNYFPANYWAQVVHQKNSSILMLYTYVISWKNENLTQLVQFFSYIVSVCSVYAISMKISRNVQWSLLSALTSMLLTEWIMQSVTTQNDLLLTAYTGTSIYFLFAFKEKLEIKYLFLAALSIGIAIGTKSSAFLLLFPIGGVLLYVIFSCQLNLILKIKYFFYTSISVLFFICIFALPAGYLENYMLYGHPVGPIAVRKEHSFEGKPVNYVMQNGTKNMARFGSEFLSLDGLPPENGTVYNAQHFIKMLPMKITQFLKIDLESNEGTRARFILEKLPFAHEDFSYWGIFGFGLVFIVILLSLFGFFTSTDARVLSFAAILFFLFQSYAGPYDPWRGRYFTTAAVFALPPVGVLIQTRNRMLRVYLFIIILLGCFSAVSAVMLRVNSSLINSKKWNRISIFSMDRIAQLTRNNPTYYEPIKKFDETVPVDATVAVFLYGDSFEYPLFGKQLTRKIIPINSFDKGIQPIPKNADYLLYMQNFPCADVHKDVFLGANWYLRRLTDRNRNCP